MFDHLEEFGDRIAIVASGKAPLSYLELVADADRIGRHVQPRSVVLVVCENTTEVIAGYIGLSRAGAVLALLLENTDAQRLGALTACYQPSHIFLPRDKADAVPNMVVCAEYGRYVLLRSQATPGYRVHDRLALLLTTSGSTGSPKFVRLSYENIESNARSIVEYLEISERDRAITTLPMHYSYGLSIVNSHLVAGASLALTNATVLEKEFWNFLDISQATNFGGVPQTYRMLKKLRFGEMRLPHLRYVTQAGGKLEASICAELADSCAERGMQFVAMYGQTEATARIAYLPWSHARSKAGSIGQAIPGGRLWVEDEQGRAIDRAGEPGELVYEGPNVSLGYAESYLDLARGDDLRGVLRTGDVAIRDTEGFYTIVGRQTRVVKMFGSRVSLDELEQLVRAAGYDCACTGVDDRLTIHVVGRGHALAVIKHVSAATGIHRSGIAAVEVEQLPLNEFGKVRYAALA